jgi:2'-5' RNA ligase
VASRHRLLVALLIDGSVATEIDGIRRALASNQLERIPPHITLIPPTNVAGDNLAEAERVVRDAAGRFEPVELTLGPPDTFPDNKSVLLLRVAATPLLTSLREALLKGPFADRDRTDRAFIAHVTLDSRHEQFVDEQILHNLRGYTASARIATLALLEQDDVAPVRPWRSITAYDFSPVLVVGRGGLEVELHSGVRLSPSSQALVASWGGKPPSPVGEGRTEWFAVASLSSEIVAVATWTVDGDVVVLGQHVVAPSLRGLGLGTRLLKFLEGLERARGRRAVVLASALDDGSEEYYPGRGYRRDVRLARAGADETALTRVL